MNLCVKSVKCLLLSEACFFLLTLIGCLLLRFTPFPENWGLIYMIFCFSVVTFLTGFIMGSHVKKRGLITGIIISLITVALIHISASIIVLKTPNPDGLLNIFYIIPLVSGVSGSIAAVNAKK